MSERTTKPNMRGFPQESVSPEVKESYGWLIQYARAIYDRRRYSVGNLDEDDKQFIINRKYAEGLQSIDKYKNKLNIAEGDRSYQNLDLSVVDIIGKYMDLWVGEMLDKDTEIQANAIDPQSKAEKSDDYDRYKANLEMKAESAELEQLTGEPLIPKGEYVPQDKEELDLHMQLNYKQATEIFTEELIDYEFYRNDFKDNLEELFIRDLGIIKRLAAKIEYDENNMIRMRNVDWANLYLPYGVKEDLSDCRYVGEIIKVSIYDLRSMAGNNLTEEQLWNIALNNAGEYGNRTWTYGDSFHKYYDRNEIVYTEYDDFLVPILDTSIISVNTDIYVKKPHAVGDGFYFETKAWDYEQPEEDDGPKKRTVYKNDMQYVYKCKWIVGSDHLIDYGIADDIIHATQNGKISPSTFHPFILLAPQQRDMENKSMLERMIPDADAIQLICLKLQGVMAKVKGPGLMVDVDALQDVMLGKGREVWSPLQLQDLYDQTSVMYYRGADDDGQPMNRKPIEELLHDYRGVFQGLIDMYNFHVMNIRNVTGINEMRDASTIDKDVPVATAEMGLQASRNATKSLDKAYRSFKGKLGKRMALMIQYNIARGRNVDYYNNVIGKKGVEALEFSDKMKLVELGIKIEALPTAEEFMLKEANINMALSKQTIELEDAITIRAIKNVKLANQYLIHKTKTRAEQKHREAMEAIQTQTEATTQSELQKEAAKQKTIMIEAKAAEQALIVEYGLKEKLSEKEFKQDIKLAEKEGDIKSRHITEAQVADLKDSSLSKAVPEPQVGSPGAGAEPSIAA